jgi:glycosyltransferase involved in cell wall biosynthesis
MANSLPVISTRHAGIPEAVLDGFTGYLVDEGDTAAMGDHIVMLALDSGLRQRMGEDGWRRVKDNFSWENEQRELLKILGLNQPIS